MEERESQELCEGCPFKIKPEIDSDIEEIFEIYTMTLDKPYLTNDVISAYKPELSRFEYLRIVQGLNEVGRTIQEINKAKDGSTN